MCHRRWSTPSCRSFSRFSLVSADFSSVCSTGCTKCWPPRQRFSAVLSPNPLQLPGSVDHRCTVGVLVSVDSADDEVGGTSHARSAPRVGLFLTWSEPAERARQSCDGALHRTPRGCVSFGGARRCAAPKPIDTSSEEHLGHILTSSIGPCSSSMMLTDHPLTAYKCPGTITKSGARPHPALGRLSRA